MVLDRVTGMLKGLPALLEKEPVLWVHRLRLGGRVAEERRVERFGTGQHPLGFDDLAPMVGPRGPFVFVVAETGDRLDSAAQVAPKRVDIVGAGKTAGQ